MPKEGRSSPMRQARPRGKPRATLRVSQAELKECQAQLVAAAEREAGFLAWVEGTRDNPELDQILAEVELAKLEKSEGTPKKEKEKKRTKGRRNRRNRSRFMRFPGAVEIGKNAETKSRTRCKSSPNHRRRRRRRRSRRNERR